MKYYNQYDTDCSQIQINEPPIEYTQKTEIEKHKEYLRHSFQIICSHRIVNAEEIEILHTYGAWMEALYLEKIKPITEKQKAFLKQIEKGTSPEATIGKAWFKYINRVEIEKKNGGLLKNQYAWIENSFYTREDYNKVHRDRLPKI